MLVKLSFFDRIVALMGIWALQRLYTADYDADPQNGHLERSIDCPSCHVTRVISDIQEMLHGADLPEPPDHGVIALSLQGIDDRDTCHLRWVFVDMHNFYRLMIGRIEVAQMSKGNATDHWFYTLRFCNETETASFSMPTEAEARAICETHAKKILL